MTFETDWSTLEIPYFVYGTLRPGHGNSVRWRGLATAICDGESYAFGYELRQQGIPYAIPGEGGPVIGTLIIPNDDWGAQYQLRQRLDALEGYPQHYDRLMVVVDTPDGCVDAWIYTPTVWDASGLTLVPSGDYNDIGIRRTSLWTGE